MNDFPFTVYFDGGCPLCSREIAHYRRLAADAAIHWVDVTQAHAILPTGVSRDQAMRVFHVADGQGRLHLGVAAFVQLWTLLPGYRWLARLVISARLLPLLEWAYRRFAERHYRKRCRDGACAL